MRNIRAILILLCMMLSGCGLNGIKTSISDMPDNLYLKGGVDVGVILCHGRAASPRWWVVNPIRKGINNKLNYHTLSLDMPAGNIDWDGYGIYFPEAYRRITLAVMALRQNGVKRIYLMGHSMGSRMAVSYLAETKNHGIEGFIGVGVRGNGDNLLNANLNLRKISIPVIDVYGDGGDKKDMWDAKDRSDLVSDNYKQILI